MSGAKLPSRRVFVCRSQRVESFVEWKTDEGLTARSLEGFVEIGMIAIESPALDRLASSSKEVLSGDVSFNPGHAC